MFFKRKEPSLAVVQDDLQQLVSDVRDLLSVKELDAIPEMRILRRRIDESLGTAKKSFAQVVEQTRQTAQSTDQYAREEPWRVAGAALAIGVVVGFLFCRR